MIETSAADAHHELLRCVSMRVLVLLAIAISSCAGEPPPRARERAATVPRPAEPAAEVAEPAVPEPASPAAPTEPDFTTPLPDDPCPPTRVHLAHRSATALPPLLTHASALRSEDGRHVRVFVADHPIERDAIGRVLDPNPGQARFEFDAVRTRRRPLEPGRLGPPGERRGGLTHVRIVTAGVLFTFGHRGIGRVELTEASAERICGRVDLDDGFGRVRGAFTAAVDGTIVR